MKTITQNKAEANGWRILAGGFLPTNHSDQLLAKKMIRYTTHTGGRAALVLRKSGKNAIYRPCIEMETKEQTARRIERIRLRGV